MYHGLTLHTTAIQRFNTIFRMFTMLLSKQRRCARVRYTIQLSLRNGRRNKNHGSTCYISWQQATNKITGKKNWIIVGERNSLAHTVWKAKFNDRFRFDGTAQHAMRYMYQFICSKQINVTSTRCCRRPLLHTNVYVIQIQYDDDWQWHFRSFNYSFHLRCIRFGNPRNMLHCMRSTHQIFSQCEC